MRINPLTAIDFYKADHRRQYPKGTSLIYSNFTPRSVEHSPLRGLPLNDDKVVFFGLQYFIKHFLQEVWSKEFFSQDLEKVLMKYKRRMDNALGEGAVPLDHIEALHSLGYLPLEIRALPEGVAVNAKVPMLTIHNTHPEFFWLTNYMETVLSSYLWRTCTSATIARYYRRLLEHYAENTGADKGFIDFQAHDFSFRGMGGLQAAAMSGAAHLLYFKGTDTVPAIDLLEDYYGANVEEELVGCSVPATEHSVMCMGSQESEIGTFRRLILEVYPKGIVSIVSDTWNFWKVVTEYVKTLHQEIMSREGKLVIRPDSGDPVKIICGDRSVSATYPEHKGAVELLWEIFGGTVTREGYKVLDPHIGLIYGDSITPERAYLILEGLKQKGFASSNVVFGVGSYTYQHCTRDTFGFAVKSTYGEVEGVPHEIFKDPITDNGVKKSAKGLVSVLLVDGEYRVYDQLRDTDGSALKIVYKDGVLVTERNLGDIRAISKSH